MDEIGSAKTPENDEEPTRFDDFKFQLNKYFEYASGIRGPLEVEENKRGYFTCCVVVSVVLTVSIVYAFVQRNKCDAEPMIPIWTLVMGIGLLSLKAIEYFRRCYKDPPEPIPTNQQELEEALNTRKKPTFPWIFSLFYLLLQIVVMPWLFLGVYWVSIAYHNRQNCDWFIFYGALLYLIWISILTAFSCFLMCCCYALKFCTI